MQSVFYQWSMLLNLAVLLFNGKINRANFYLFNICMLPVQVHSLTNVSPSWKLLDINQSELVKSQIPVTVKIKPHTLIAALNGKYNYPAINKLPLISVNNILAEQENSKRIKKSVPKQEKQVPGKEMRKKLKQLMANITETLNDMDWYFGLDQLENPVTAKKKQTKKSNRKVDNSNIPETNENEVTNDLLLDLFIKQIYDINPIVFEKLRNRINDRSSLKRQARLAQLSEKENQNQNLNPVFQATKDKSRKCIVKKVFLRKMVPDYRESEFDEEAIDTPSQTSSEKDKQNVDTFKELKNITTSTPSTTFETFYDYGDYYKNNDYNAPDIFEYDINRVDVEYSTNGNHENTGNGYRRKNVVKFYPRRKIKYRT